MDKTVSRALVDALSPFIPAEHDILDVADAIVAALGIPASTLASLRAGEMVAVPRGDVEMLRLAAATVTSRLSDVCDALVSSEERMLRWLAAAQPRRDEGNGDG